MSLGLEGDSVMATLGSSLVLGLAALRTGWGLASLDSSDGTSFSRLYLTLLYTSIIPRPCSSVHIVLHGPYGVTHYRVQSIAHIPFSLLRDAP